MKIERIVQRLPRLILIMRMKRRVEGWVERIVPT